MRFSKIIVAAVIALNALFAIAVLAVFWHTGSEPAVLVGAWFAFTTGELWTLGKIKRNADNKKEGNQNEREVNDSACSSVNPDSTCNSPADEI